MNRKTLLLAAALLISFAAAYFHLTKELETYGITANFARPISTPVPAGLNSLKAEECGQCHQEIYKEWKTSIHSKAWSDDYLQTDWKYDKRKQNCRNCHTPFENQQPDLVIGFKNGNLWKPILKPNADFDPAFQREGVTCASCHVENGTIKGPHMIKDAPHPVQYAPEMRNGMGVCVRCHVTEATSELSIGDPNICSTMNEIMANKIQPNCINCHMPKITRPLMEGYPPRPGRQHLWRGAHDQKMVSKALRIDLKEKSIKGSIHTYDIVLTNIGTHHKLPTGTPDRKIVVVMELRDKTDQIVATRTHTIIRRIIWRPVIFEWSDNRLAFQKPQKISFKFNTKGHKPPFTLKVKALYYFLEDWRRNQLKLDAASHPPFVMQQTSIAIPSSG